MAATNECLPVILRPKTNKRISLHLFASQVPAGFPSPADDYVERSIDLNEYLIKNKLATFIVKADGDSMSLEIHSGDLLVVDRSLEPQSGHVVIASIDGEVTVKRFVVDGERHLLVPANPDHEVIEVNGDQELIIWGVVRFSIHKVC